MEEKIINGRKHIKLLCPITNDFFWKDKSEYTRQKKKNKDYIFYKNLSISQRISAKHNLGKYYGVGNLRTLLPNNKKDEYSPFRYYIRKAREKTKLGGKFIKFDIDEKYLKELWEEQKGICPYTSIKMKLPDNSKCKLDSPFFASLDRTDTNIGYVRGNVKFVTQFVNLGKNKYLDEVIKDFLSKICVN